MILKHISLRGAIGIKDGVGQEQVDIDFTAFQPGLVAIIGPNGSGKSTLVGNLVPYRSGLHTRPGGLARHFYLKDSHRDLLLAIGGDEYRFRLNINGERGTIAESVVIKNGVPMNPDGKEGTYNEIVEKLFGPEDLFYRSLFMPQKRDSLSDLTPVKRKDILLQLMGAEQIQVKCEYAGKRASAINAEIEKAEAEIKVLWQQFADIGNLDDALIDIETQLASCAEGTREVTATITDTESEIADLQEREKAQAVLAEQIRQAEARMADLRKSREDITADYRKRIESVDGERRRASTERDRLSLHRSEDARKRLVMAVDGVEKITADYLASVEIGNKHADLSRQLAEARTEYAEAKREYDAECAKSMAARRDAATALKTAEERFLNEQRRLSETIDRKKRSVKIMEAVPCQQTAEAEKCRECQFLKDAVAAQSEIEALSDAQFETARDWAEEKKGYLAAIEAAGADTFEAFETTATGRELLAKGKALSEQVTALGYDATRATDLKRRHEENQRTDPAERLRQYDADGEKIEQLGQVITGALEQIKLLDSEGQEKLTAIDADCVAYQARKADLTAKIDVTIPLRLRDKRDDLAKARQRQAELADQRQALATQQERLIIDKGKATEIEADIATKESTIAALRSDAADWSHLNLSLSRNGGFQSILVESFGQEISAYINERLPAYRLPWSVEIATSKPLADGKGMTDGFWVMINTEPFPRELSLISGGQEVWVEALIYDAIASIMRRRSGKVLQTVIRDEADGALTEENAMIYSQVIAASHEASGLYQTMLITHRPEIQRSIPQRLVFVKGEGIRTEIE